eukprot:g12139.t1
MVESVLLGSLLPRRSWCLQRQSENAFSTKSTSLGENPAHDDSFENNSENQSVEIHLHPALELGETFELTPQPFIEPHSSPCSKSTSVEPSPKTFLPADSPFSLSHHDIEHGEFEEVPLLDPYEKSVVSLEPWFASLTPSHSLTPSPSSRSTLRRVHVPTPQHATNRSIICGPPARIPSPALALPHQAGCLLCAWPGRAVWVKIGIPCFCVPPAVRCTAELPQHP